MQKLFKFISFQMLTALFLFGPGMPAAMAAFAVGSGAGDGTIPSPPPGAASGSTLGSVIQSLIANTSSLTGLLSMVCYMGGLLFGFMAIIKAKEHVENPSQVKISDPVKRAVGAGAFFAAPYIIDVIRKTISGDDDGGGYANSGFNGASTSTGLDGMIVKLMADIFVPAQNLFGWFGYIAGIILVIVGISRLLQTEQQGPKGPTGIGTITTFVVAGCLFSINSMISYLTTTLFDSSSLKTSGVLAYTDGLAGAEAHVHAVISAVVAFSIVLGWVSLLRGFFIVRGVSEGDSQSSMMAAITHIIGGVMAINLGSIINAVQSTLGIAKYGINFS